ncbi:unnamed protein product [Prunus armeniaca]|uniref:Uncharacterized protein n=1 Tax=Prunus armeniaca TaxID=36596 RepID=A0A6J5TTY4_PRUAR|nr:unnamed protein product [Prunus armeniaca]
MSGLQEWEGVGGVKEEDSDKITIMPCLSSLNITLCSGLKTLPGFLLKSPLQNLFFRHCRSLARSYRQGTGKEWHKISHIPNITIDETDPDFDDEEGHEIVQEKHGVNKGHLLVLSSGLVQFRLPIQIGRPGMVFLNS